jgi:hypothetical protein
VAGIFGGGFILVVGMPLSFEYLHGTSFTGGMAINENMFLFSIDTSILLDHNED